MKIEGSISVILPAYNESANIGDTITRCVSALERFFKDFEIIVVDDGSSDGTSNKVKKLFGEDSRIRIVRHEHNKGYGAALRSGFSSAEKNWLFFMDSDGQFDPYEIEKLLPLMSNDAVIAGYRIRRSDSFYRKVMGYIYTKVINLTFGLKVKDLNCAFKLMPTEFVKSLALSSSGALINAEILVRASERGITLKEVGVNHYPRRAGKQSGGSLRVIMKAVKEFFSVYWALKKFR